MKFNKIFNPVHSQSRLFRIYLALDTFLVSPVSCNPVFGNLVHFLGTDLDFNGPFWPINRCMDRLVTIGFRIGNIVFKTARHRTPEFMDVSQHGVNITVRLHNTTDGNQIIDLIKALFLVAHLTINRVDMFWTTINITNKSLFSCVSLNFIDNLVHKFLTLTTFFLHHVRNLVEFHLIKVTEGHVFQFPFDTTNTQTVGQRSIDFHSFARNALLLILTKMLKGTHIVQTIGQFNQDDTDILRHGHKHLTVVFSQLLLVGLVLNLTKLSNTVHDISYIRTKIRFQIIKRFFGVFNDIV